MVFDWIDPEGRTLSIDTAEPIHAEITKLSNCYESGIENHLPDVTLQLIASRFDSQIDQLRQFFFTVHSAQITELPNFIKTSELRLAWWQENVHNVPPPQKDVTTRAISPAQLSIFDAGSNSAMPIDWFEAYSCLQEMSQYRLPTHDKMEAAIKALDIVTWWARVLEQKIQELRSEKAKGSNAIDILKEINHLIDGLDKDRNLLEEIIK